MLSIFRRGVGNLVRLPLTPTAPTRFSTRDPFAVGNPVIRPVNPRSSKLDSNKSNWSWASASGFVLGSLFALAQIKSGASMQPDENSLSSNAHPDSDRAGETSNSRDALYSFLRTKYSEDELKDLNDLELYALRFLEYFQATTDAWTSRHDDLPNAQAVSFNEAQIELYETVRDYKLKAVPYMRISELELPADCDGYRLAFTIQSMLENEKLDWSQVKQQINGKTKDELDSILFGRRFRLDAMRQISSPINWDLDAQHWFDSEYHVKALVELVNHQKLTPAQALACLKPLTWHQVVAVAGGGDPRLVTKMNEKQCWVMYMTPRESISSTRLLDLSFSNELERDFYIELLKDGYPEAQASRHLLSLKNNEFTLRKADFMTIECGWPFFSKSDYGQFRVEHPIVGDSLSESKTHGLTFSPR